MSLEHIESPFIAHDRAVRLERQRAARLVAWVVFLTVAAVCGWGAFLLVVFKF